MENKNQANNSDYQFIREKVVSRKKNRLKKMLFISAFTIFLAILFGIVARLVFLCADDPLKRFLGIAEPSPTPNVTPTPIHTPSPTPTLAPSNSPTPTPDIIDIVTPEPPTPTIYKETDQERAERVLSDYAAVFSALQQIETKVKKSIVTVEAVENGVDWLDNTYEMKSQTPGIILKKTKVYLLVLVSLDRIQSASEIIVNIGDRQCTANLWNYDTDCNLAVIQVDLTGVSPQHFDLLQEAVIGDSSLPRVGTPILVLGSPNGYIGSFELGMVTSRGSVYYITDNSVDLFNTNTTDSASGDGVIVNLSGEVIGIITRTLKENLNQSLCTAIGNTKLKGILEQLISKEKRIYFGIRGEDIPLASLQEASLSNGIYITDVLADSPASEAGIKTGDILLKVNGTNVYSYSGFHRLLSTHSIGEELNVTIQRTGRLGPKLVELKVVLAGK